ncbi:DeoR/GlpR family DNA-binding transcription regulator [Polycladidibacter stylochi]|uniref:DeoR/GlpR family DNA-binding transcription regulator n=1 Tax=Polycladidibacter stylochi TaxID=1807766 RepID=UPI00082F782D|nr:DeoR/GlpR family DNA-binding transcription regulator [Pseudovibrio stylochi]
MVTGKRITDLPEAVELAKLVERLSKVPIEFAAELLETPEENILALSQELAKGGDIKIIDRVMFHHSPRVEQGYLQRMRSHHLEKFNIAREAMQHIQAGMKVGIEAGSTLTLFAERLASISPLEVHTNFYPVGAALMRNSSGISVHMSGGTMLCDGAGVVGLQALAHFESRDLDVVVLSPTAINAEGELMYYREESAQLVKVMMQCAKQTIVLCHAAKIGSQSWFCAGHVRDASVLVTDCSLGAQAEALLKKNGLQSLEVAVLEEDVPSELVVLDI